MFDDRSRGQKEGDQAMDQFSNAAIFIWAATERCGKATESQVKCEVDIYLCSMDYFDPLLLG